LNKNPFLVYKGLPKSLYFLFAARVIDNMGCFILPLITLILTEKIGLSKSNAGIFATIFMCTQAPFLLLGGRLIDKIGSKKVIVIFNILGALAYIPCAIIKPSIYMAWLIALAANLFSVSSPAFSSIVAEIVPKEKLRSAYSFVYLGFNLGLAVGPVLGGLFFNDYLHALFILDAISALISSLLIMIFVKDSKSKKEDSLHSNLHFKIHSDTSVRKFLLDNPLLIIFSLVILLYNFSYSQWSFMLPIQISELFVKSGARYYSFLVGINALVVIILTPVITYFTHKFSTITIIAAGGIFYISASILFSINKFYAIFIIAVITLTIGQILINLNTNIFVAHRTPPKYLGRANSMLSLINGAGIAAGPIIMGNVVSILTFWQAWMIISGLMLIATLAMFKLRKYDKLSS